MHGEGSLATVIGIDEQLLIQGKIWPYKYGVETKHIKYCGSE